VTAGYSWQRFYTSEHNYGSTSEAGRPTTLGFNSPYMDADGNYLMEINTSSLTPGSNYSDDLVDAEGNYHYREHLQLLSFFGRVNYTFMDRYLATVTVRGDATSRFSKDNRWGAFPSVALGWRIIEESFMEQSRSWLNDLKLRLGWGMTGQQEVGSTCNYLPLYSIAGPGSYYPVTDTDGNITYLPGYFLQGYNPDLKWETTTTWNAGLDFAFLSNRITASFDWYLRKTKDLLSYVTIPAGSSTVNMLNRNIGDLENYGVEFNITARPVVTKDFNWTISYNVGYNHNEITKLNDASTIITTGGISGGTGNTVQAHAVGHSASSFYLLQQVYDASGNPIEGVFVDQNGDGQINSDDKVINHSPDPKVTMTMSNQFTYKKWDLGISLRASIGNYVYNNVLASNSAISGVNQYGLSNLVKADYYFKSKSTSNYYMSDYFLENGSFLRCDNITLGYTWDNLLNNNLRLRLFGAVQNPFVITKYSGIDPEVYGGIDNNVYPRATTYSIGVVATF
jgi:iron complex outermembrane receptor protein